MEQTITSKWTDFVSTKVWDSPNVPTNLTVTDLGNEVDVQLNWTNNSGANTIFEIERQTQLSPGIWGSTINFHIANGLTTCIDSPGIGIHRYKIKATLIVSTIIQANIDEIVPLTITATDF